MFLAVLHLKNGGGPLRLVAVKGCCVGGGPCVCRVFSATNMEVIARNARPSAYAKLRLAQVGVKKLLTQERF